MVLNLPLIFDVVLVLFEEDGLDLGLCFFSRCWVSLEIEFNVSFCDGFLSLSDLTIR